MVRTASSLGRSLVREGSLEETLEHVEGKVGLVLRHLVSGSLDGGVRVSVVGLDVSSGGSIDGPRPVFRVHPTKRSASPTFVINNKKKEKKKKGRTSSGGGGSG